MGSGQDMWRILIGPRGQTPLLLGFYMKQRQAHQGRMREQLDVPSLTGALGMFSVVPPDSNIESHDFDGRVNARLGRR